MNAARVSYLLLRYISNRKRLHFLNTIKYTNIASIDCNRFSITPRFYSIDKSKEVASQKENQELEFEDDLKDKEENLQMKRDKSALNDRDYKIINGKAPHFLEHELHIMPLSKYRELYGRFGSSLNIDVKALWPSTKELELMKEKEKFEFPHSVQEMIHNAKQARIAEEERIWKEQLAVKEKLKSLDTWMNRVKDKIRQKEEDALEALKRKEKQMDDVRDVLGYRVPPSHPKFQEIIEKEEEERKLEKKKTKKLRKERAKMDRLIREAQAEETVKPEFSIGQKIE